MSTWIGRREGRAGIAEGVVIAPAAMLAVSAPSLLRSRSA